MTKTVEYKEFECKHCGKKFEKTLRYVRSETKKGKEIKYCSRECSNLARRKTVSVICDTCNIEFNKLPNKIGIKNFCCKECLDKYNLSKKTELTCMCCNKKFFVDNSYIKSQEERNQPILYCSRECKINMQRNNILEVNCSYCNNKFLKSKNKIGKMNFCDIECKNNYHKEHDNIEIACKHCNKKFTINKYKAIIQNRQFCDWNCKTAYYGIIYDNYKNISHYLRTIPQYEKWRLDVINKADKKCVECGEKNNLQAHHINSLFNISKMYNFDKDIIKESAEFNDINNGKCLCQKCHNKIHVYMKQKQYID